MDMETTTTTHHFALRKADAVALCGATTDPATLSLVANSVDCPACRSIAGLGEPTGDEVDDDEEGWL